MSFCVTLNKEIFYYENGERKAKRIFVFDHVHINNVDYPGVIICNNGPVKSINQPTVFPLENLAGYFYFNQQTNENEPTS